jgi:uncharacterized protein (DUF433 family)
MKYDSHLDFLAPDDIRIRGTRIGIETVVHEYERGHTPDEIVARYPGLSLSGVFATLAYYLENKEAVDAYLATQREVSRRSRVQQDRSPSPGIARLRALKRAGSNGAADHD